MAGPIVVDVADHVVAGVRFDGTRANGQKKWNRKQRE
jgi:hypothetical protein